MSTDHTSMWVSASRDYDAEAAERRFAMAKVAATQNTWSFLAGANSEDEFRARFDLVDDRVKAAVASVSPDDQELLEAVESALHEDFLLVHNSPDRIAARDAEAVKVAIETQKDHERARRNKVPHSPHPFIGNTSGNKDLCLTCGGSNGGAVHKVSKAAAMSGGEAYHSFEPQAGNSNACAHPTAPFGEPCGKSPDHILHSDEEHRYDYYTKQSDLDNAAQPANNSVPGAAEGYVQDVPITPAPDYGTITEPADFDDSHGLDPNVDATTGGTPYQASKEAVNKRQKQHYMNGYNDGTSGRGHRYEDYPDARHENQTTPKEYDEGFYHALEDKYNRDGSYSSVPRNRPVGPSSKYASKESAWDSVSRLDFSNGREAKSKAGDFEHSDFTDELHDELKHHKKRKKEFADAAENLIESFGATAEIHAPYRIKPRGSKWVVVNDKNPPDVKGTFDSWDEAREQQKALYASVPGASEMAERKHKAASIWDSVKDYGHDVLTFPRDMATEGIPAFPDLARGIAGGTSYVDEGQPHYVEIEPVPGGYIAVCTEGDFTSRVAPTATQARSFGDKHNNRLTTWPGKPNKDWQGKEDAVRAVSKVARTFSQDQRDKLAESGAALEDGSFPIENAEDLENAKHDIGRGSNHSRQTIINHINQRAKALGLPGVGEQKESGLDFLKKIVGPVDKVLNPKPSTAEADDPDYPGESIEMKQFWGTQPTKDDEERWLQ